MRANARLKSMCQVSARNSFISITAATYARKDHVVANLEIAAPYMAKQAKFFNYFTKLKVTQTLVEKR